MGNALKIENFNPLMPVSRLMKNKHPNLARRLDAIWDEGITGKRQRRAFIAKTRGPDYEPLI